MRKVNRWGDGLLKPTPDKNFVLARPGASLFALDQGYQGVLVQKLLHLLSCHSHNFQNLPSLEYLPRRNIGMLYSVPGLTKSGHLDVGSGHSIYWEEAGLPDGVPILYLHGGPGGGIQDSDRQYFDPSHYRSVLFDQRGGGKSTPHASLDNNTTWDLVEDIEKLRKYLRVEKWIVFGGSWGSTLTLAYAESHPERCLGLIIRGIFTLRREELLWFYQSGANFLFPDYFDAYESVIPIEEREDMMKAYYKRLTGSDRSVQLKWYVILGIVTSYICTNKEQF